MILKREFEHVFQEGVGLAHADAELELERHFVIIEIDRQDRDRLAFMVLTQPAKGPNTAATSNSPSTTFCTTYQG